MSDLKLCRTCGESFDALLKYHAEVGYIDQCGDCARDEGDHEVPVKAFTGFNKDGDWIGIEIVSNEEFSEFEKVKETYDG